MPTCIHCGAEIEFRTVLGVTTPIHVDGGYCSGLAGRDAGGAARPHDYLWGTLSSYTAPSNCPLCGDAVYFIRHNGGCVWVDELGWPWPKHACFDRTTCPNWLSFLEATPALQRGEINARSVARESHSDLQAQFEYLIGVVVAARPLGFGDQRFIGIGVEGHKFRRCLGVPHVNRVNSYIDSLILIDIVDHTFRSSNGIRGALVDVCVSSTQLGLPVNWVETIP